MIRNNEFATQAEEEEEANNLPRFKRKLFPELIRKNPVLYDRKHPLFSNKEIQDTVWEQIAKSCHLKDGLTAKRKYIFLRSSYLKSKRIKKETKEFGPCADPEPILKEFSFLDEFIIPRRKRYELSSGDSWKNDNLFIDIIRKNPVFYQKNHPDYNNKVILDKLWKQIAKVCDLPDGPTARHRYIVYRNKFARKKRQHEMNLENGINTPPDPIVQQCNFLSSHIKHRSKKAKWSGDEDGSSSEAPIQLPPPASAIEQDASYAAIYLKTIDKLFKKFEGQNGQGNLCISDLGQETMPTRTPTVIPPKDNSGHALNNVKFEDNYPELPIPEISMIVKEEPVDPDVTYNPYNGDEESETVETPLQPAEDPFYPYAMTLLKAKMESFSRAQIPQKQLKLIGFINSL